MCHKNSRGKCQMCHKQSCQMCQNICPCVKCVTNGHVKCVAKTVRSSLMILNKNDFAN